MIEVGRLGEWRVAFNVGIAIINRLHFGMVYTTYLWWFLGVVYYCYTLITEDDVLLFAQSLLLSRSF